MCSRHDLQNYHGQELHVPVRARFIIPWPFSESGVFTEVEGAKRSETVRTEDTGSMKSTFGFNLTMYWLSGLCCDEECFQVECPEQELSSGVGE
jgi:hypothetical protein